VVTGLKELGFIPKYERYDGGTQARKGPMAEEQKAERKTLIAKQQVPRIRPVD
jgi:ParB family chromosome partitioning protein